MCRLHVCHIILGGFHIWRPQLKGEWGPHKADKGNKISWFMYVTRAGWVKKSEFFADVIYESPPGEGRKKCDTTVMLSADRCCLCHCYLTLLLINVLSVTFRPGKTSTWTLRSARWLTKWRGSPSRPRRRLPRDVKQLAAFLLPLNVFGQTCLSIREGPIVKFKA